MRILRNAWGSVPRASSFTSSRLPSPSRWCSNQWRRPRAGAVRQRVLRDTSSVPQPLVMARDQNREDAVPRVPHNQPNLADCARQDRCLPFARARQNNAMGLNSSLPALRRTRLRRSRHPRLTPARVTNGPAVPGPANGTSRPQCAAGRVSVPPGRNPLSRRRWCPFQQRAIPPSTGPAPQAKLVRSASTTTSASEQGFRPGRRSDANWRSRGRAVSVRHRLRGNTAPDFEECGGQMQSRGNQCQCQALDRLGQFDLAGPFAPHAGCRPG